MVSDAYMPTHSRANPVDEVITIDSSVESLIDVDSGVSVVDSDFLEREVTTPEPFFSLSHITHSYSHPQIKTETQARRLELEAKVAEKAGKKVKEAAKKQKKADKTPGSSSSLSSQFQNPIVLANAITVAAVSAVLGFTGFRKHQAGQLSWKVVGVWSGFVAAFGTADYFLSRFVGAVLSSPSIYRDQS